MMSPNRVAVAVLAIVALQSAAGLLASVGEDAVLLQHSRRSSPFEFEEAAKEAPAADPAAWVQVFRQTSPTMFSPNELSKNPTDATNDNFAILDKLEQYRVDGKFTFKLRWPADGLKDQIWSQTSNPTKEKVSGYQEVSAPYSSRSWGGLEKGGTYSLMDGSVNTGNWFYAVGSFRQWSGAYPGPANKVTQVELWVMPEVCNVLDTDDAAVVGAWTSSVAATGFKGIDYLHDGNKLKGDKSVTYKMPDGKYNVKVGYTPHANRASNTPVQVTIGGQSTTHTINQRQNLFHVLGEFSFTSGDTVSISNKGTNGYVIADSVQLCPILR